QGRGGGGFRSDRRGGRKVRTALFEVRGEAFFYIGAAEAEKLKRERRVECRTHRAQPIVERIFGPADRALRSLGQLGRDLDGLRLKLVVVDRERNQADAFGFLTQNLV